MSNAMHALTAADVQTAAGQKIPRPRRGGAKTRHRIPKDELILPTGTWRPRGPRNGLTFVDFLCGAGGSSAGFANAGWDLRGAVNHWQVAINTHQANFGDAPHWCEDISSVHMRGLPRAHALWASPICTELSPAGGNGKSGGWEESEESKRGQVALFDDEEEPVAQEGLEKTRATFWSIIQYVEVHRPEYVIVENVPDAVRKWALFKNWLGCMEDLKPGYVWQVIMVNSAHIGSLEDGIPYVPQWRDRMYVKFVRKDLAERDIDATPRPMSYCWHCERIVNGVQTWCEAVSKHFIKAGRYRRNPNTSYGSYWYTCPNGCRDEKGKRARVEPFTRPAVSIIDWSDLGTPLEDGRVVASSLERIAEGQDKFWTPGIETPPTFVFNTNHGDSDGRCYLPGGRPISALTTKLGEGLCLPPYTAILGGRWPDGPAEMTRPTRTLMTTEAEALVMPPDVEREPFIAVLRNHAEGDSLRGPLSTVTSGGTHFSLVLPYGAGDTTGSLVADGPRAEPHRVPIRGKGKGAKGRTVMVQPAQVRMFKSLEAARAQTLPVDEGYVITGNVHEQHAQIGNAVSSSAAQTFGLIGAQILGAA